MTHQLKLTFASLLILLASLAGCGGGGGGGTPDPSRYISTSSRGDLVNYTVTGSNVLIEWNATNDVGAIDYTWNLVANCGARDATFGHRTCTIASASCAVGAAPVLRPRQPVQSI